MKIACDVKGTLEGPKKQQVLRILELFKKAGYDIYIWSNLYSYAVEARSKNNLDAEVRDKSTKGDQDFDESKYFDYAIEDDRSQDWLATKQFIFVDEIPEDMVQVDMFVKELLEGQ